MNNVSKQQIKKAKDRLEKVENVLKKIDEGMSVREASLCYSTSFQGFARTVAAIGGKCNRDEIVVDIEKEKNRIKELEMRFWGVEERKQLRKMYKENATFEYMSVVLKKDLTEIARMIKVTFFHIENKKSEVIDDFCIKSLSDECMEIYKTIKKSVNKNKQLLIKPDSEKGYKKIMDLATANLLSFRLVNVKGRSRLLVTLKREL